MRILYLVNALVFGGAELQTVSIACRMRKLGHEVLVVSMTPPVALTDVLERSDVRWKSLDMKRGIPSPRAFRAYLGIVKAFKPEVVHTHLTHANIMGRAARFFRSVPVLVSTIHSTQDRQKWTRSAYRLSDRLCDLTTGPSSAVAKAYVERGSVPAFKMRVVANGIDFDAIDAARGDALDARMQARSEFGASAEAFVWIAAGRLMPAKDYPTLLAAFSEIAESDTVLWICGEGPLKEELAALIAAKGLTGRVKLLGLRKDLPRVMAASDAFVLSSAWEGFGLVAAEALNAGLPVVSTDCGGIGDIISAEMLRNDSALSIVPIRDPAALREAMLRTERQFRAADSGSRAEAAKARRIAVRTSFDLDAVVCEWQRIYLELSHRSM